MSHLAIDLLEKMLVFDPNKRITGKKKLTNFSILKTSIIIWGPLWKEILMFIFITYDVVSHMLLLKNVPLMSVPR